MIAPTQIKKTENWQDFEKLCKKLWGEVWQCSDIIQRNGRLGQEQHGVDVYGKPKGENGYYGIQCKGKDDYTNSQLTEAEIVREISKAQSFEPKLKRLIFATTANKDAKIESFIRLKNLESINSGSFEIYLSSWEDIVDLLEQYRETYNWYLNNCQYKEVSDVCVDFDNTDTITISPQYIRTTTYTKLKVLPPMPDCLKSIGWSLEQWKQLQAPYSSPVLSDLRKTLDSIQRTNDMMRPNSSHDYRWCRIDVFIENTGSTVLEDYKLYIYLPHSSYENIDGGFHYMQHRIGINETVIAQINNKIDRDRNVFEITDGVYFEPGKSLVQKDNIGFHFSIIPTYGESKIPLRWQFLSRNFNKEGILTIIVQPQYEDKEVTIEVEDSSDLNEPTIKITPKTI